MTGRLVTVGEADAAAINNCVLADALLPSESVAVMVIGCVPISLADGVQEKAPELLIALVVIVEEEKASLTENVVVARPVAFAVKVSGVPTFPLYEKETRLICGSVTVIDWVAVPLCP